MFVDFTSKNESAASPNASEEEEEEERGTYRSVFLEEEREREEKRSRSLSFARRVAILGERDSREKETEEA